MNLAQLQADPAVFRERRTDAHAAAKNSLSLLVMTQEQNVMGRQQIDPRLAQVIQGANIQEQIERQKEEQRKLMDEQEQRQRDTLARLFINNTAQRIFSDSVDFEFTFVDGEPHARLLPIGILNDGESCDDKQVDELIKSIADQSYWASLVLAEALGIISRKKSDPEEEEKH